MVFKFLQEFPLGRKSLALQALYGLVLWSVVVFLNLSQLAFLAGFLFAHIYILLFFYSVLLIFKQKNRKLGLTFLFIKWMFLLFVLFFVSFFLKDRGGTFLIGLSSLLSFLLLYVLENLKKQRL